MGEIKSNKVVASACATDLANAVDALTNGSTATKDSSTTVAGNQDAHDAIDLAKQTAGQVAAAVQSAAANIQSVADEFEAVDQAIRQMNSIPGAMPPPAPGKAPFSNY